MATKILVGDKVYRESDPRLRPDRGHQVQCLRPDQVVQQLARDGRSGPRAGEGPPTNGRSTQRHGASPHQAGKEIGKVKKIVMRLAVLARKNKKVAHVSKMRFKGSNMFFWYGFIREHW